MHAFARSKSQKKITPVLQGNYTLDSDIPGVQHYPPFGQLSDCKNSLWFSFKEILWILVLSWHIACLTFFFKLPFVNNNPSFLVFQKRVAEDIARRLQVTGMSQNWTNGKVSQGVKSRVITRKRYNYLLSKISFFVIGNFALWLYDGWWGFFGVKRQRKQIALRIKLGWNHNLKFLVNHNITACIFLVLLSVFAAKWNLGKAKIKTMPMRGNLKLDRKFLVVVALCLFACLLIAWPLCLLFWKFFCPSCPDSDKFWVCRYSTDCISVMVLLVVPAGAVTPVLSLSIVHEVWVGFLLSSFSKYWMCSTKCALQKSSRNF